VFLGYGGHSGAGGFSVTRSRLDEAIALLADGAERAVPVDEIGAVLTVDAAVPLGALTLSAALGVRSLAPFGVGFPEPLFLAQNVVVGGVRPMGGGKHVRLRLKDDHRAYRDAVWFNAPPEIALLQRGTRVDVVFHLCVNEWEGVQRPELRLRDWRPAE
jgi:single-stranded-DNA-specific exonuclease